MESQRKVDERILNAKSGWGMLFLFIIGIIVGIVLSIFSQTVDGFAEIVMIAVSIILFVFCIIMLGGFKVINPNEALVLALFGNYYGTLKKDGFYWVNPFVSPINPTVKDIPANTGRAKKVSLKTRTLNNEKQKVNDAMGNPVEIAAVVIWRVVDPTKAVLNVENFNDYLSIQCDSIIRNTTRIYPYDAAEGGDEKSLRGSSQEIADIMQAELKKKKKNAGIEILDVRITHLAYAPEIASAMLQRQQAAAIIDARQKIVEGAVGMVEMALDKLGENNIVELDEERKAAMVSNLLVVLCGNKDAQPIVNSGSLY